MKTSNYIPLMSTEYKKWYVIPTAPKELLAREDGYILNTVTGNMTRGSWVGHYLRYRWQGVNYYMQRLICLAFHGLPSDSKMVANHIDGNKRNNRAKNLEWVSQQLNVLHGYNTGLYKNKGINRSAEEFNLNSDLIPLFEYDHHMNPEYMSEIIGRNLVQFEDYTYTTLDHHKMLYKPLYDITVIDTNELASLAEIQIERCYGRYVPGVLFYLNEEDISELENFRSGEYTLIENSSPSNKLLPGIIISNKELTPNNKQVYIDANYKELILQATNWHADFFHEDHKKAIDINNYATLYKDYLI